MGTHVCPGCGLSLESSAPGLSRAYFASNGCVALFGQLQASTLTLGRDDFVHQTAVDTYAAQHYGPGMKPITITFALIGLHLTFERGFTGRQVQLAHMRLGKTRRPWPSFDAPRSKAAFTVYDVLNGCHGNNYPAAIQEWGKSVWDLWQPEHERVARLVDTWLNS
jgi:hypothetical protein